MYLLLTKVYISITMKCGIFLDYAEIYECLQTWKQEGFFVCFEGRKIKSGKPVSDKPQDQGFILGIYMEQRENLIPASGPQELPKPQK